MFDTDGLKPQIIKSSVAYAYLEDDEHQYTGSIRTSKCKWMFCLSQKARTQTTAVQKVKAARVRMAVLTVKVSEWQKVPYTSRTKTLALNVFAAKAARHNVCRSPASRRAVSGNASKESVVSSDVSMTATTTT